MGQFPRRLQNTAWTDGRAADLAVQGQPEEAVHQKYETQRLAERSNAGKCALVSASPAREETEREDAEMEDGEEQYEPTEPVRSGRESV